MTNLMKKISVLISRYPLVVLLIALGIIYGVILISIFLRTDTENDDVYSIGAKKVQAIRMHDSRYATVYARVDKDGEVMIVSQTSGIVSDVHITDGQKVARGQRMIQLTDTYGGGNSAAIAYKIAERQNALQRETFEKNMSIVDDQRDDVSKTDDKASSIERKQFTIQKRNLEAQRDIVQLQQQQAGISAALYAPVSPFHGVVDHVFVSRGDMINPGDKIAAVNADSQQTRLVTNVSATLANVIDVNVPSKIRIKDEWVEILPQHLSRGLADEQSYVMTYEIPEELGTQLVNNAYVEIMIPLEKNDSSWTLMPIDAVRLMNNATVIFVVDGDRARSIAIESGSVVGGLIFVRGDIDPEARVIVDRNVFEGDQIIVQE